MVVPAVASDGPIVIEVTGPVDAHTVQQVVALVQAAVAGSTVDIDLSQVDLLDSIALGRLLDAVSEAATRHVDVRFCRPSSMVQRVASLTARTDRILHGRPS